ncbi:MAG TPA: hypothetical protein VH592_16010 [Gemmataceae bacterium]|jgi:hypothetical protein
MLRNRSCSLQRLAAFAAVFAVLLAAEISQPALATNAPPKSIPGITKLNTTKANWFGINWNKLVPKSIPKIHIPTLKLPAHMKAPRAAHIPKQVPKQVGPAPQAQARTGHVPTAPNSTPQPRVAASKPQPIMKPALHELSEALLYVNASPLLATRSRNALGSHISQALTSLGGEMPKANGAPKRGNHLKLAEEHLHRANKEVLLLTHLSPEVHKAVLKEIKSATDLVKKHANAIAGKGAKP